MAAFYVVIRLEPFRSKAGGKEARDWLGQVLTVSLETKGEGAALPSSPESLELLSELLRPWKWVLSWKGSQNPADPTWSFDSNPLDTYLDAILGRGEHTPPADALRRLRFPAAGSEETGGTEDESESEPNWPFLLMQFARFGPQITHPMKLAHLFGPDETRSLVELESILVPGEVEVLAVNGSVQRGDDTYYLLVERVPEPAVLPDRVGLINTTERLVHASQDDKATAGWLAELPYRLGQALDPLARIPDLLEIAPGAFPPKGDPVDIPLFLGKIFGPPSDLAPIFLVVLAADAGPGEVDLKAMATFAAAWASSFALPSNVTNTERGLRRGVLRRLLGYGPEQQSNPTVETLRARPSPDALRAAYAGAVYDGGDLEPGIPLTLDGYVRHVLEAALPAADSEPTDHALRERATRWLHEPANVSQFIRGLLPEALARRTLYPEMVEAVKGVPDDWTPMREFFVAEARGYAAALAGVLIPLQPVPPQTPPQTFPPKDIPASMVARECERVFQTEREGVDRGAEIGLPFRVDTIFHQPGAEDEDQQLHAMLDGYVVAISPSKVDGAGSNWRLVTTGQARLLTGGRSAAPTTPIEVTTPLQVSFELPFEPKPEGGPELEIRNAAAGYHGQAMIPWARPVVDTPNDQGDDIPPAEIKAPSVQIEYTPSTEPNAYPPLAYGQDYRIACGYQAPGGILPMGFARSDAPWAFDADDGFLSEKVEPPRYQTVPFRRTLIPGAPRLFAKAGDAVLVVASPGDEKVRPLWREHVARWPEKYAGQRSRLDETPTLFLDPLASQGGSNPSTFDFRVGPPVLALGEQNGNATNAAVWRYWIERDRQHDPATVAEPLAPGALEVDDPAVVGRVNGKPDGAGGVRFSLLRITPGGPEDVQRQDVVLNQRSNRISVQIIAGALPGIQSNPANGLEVAVTVTPGQRFILEARTLCDARFLPNGDDERFSDSAKAKTFGAIVDGKVAFGAVSLAIEVLPEEDHLPSSAQLWGWLDLGNEVAVGAVLRTEPAGETPLEDYIDHVRLTHQLYTPDGGPAPKLSSFGIDWNDVTEKPLGIGGAKTRDPRYEEFEAAMFLGRGLAGMETVARRVSGGLTELLALDLPRNRGADYLRARLSVTSRYSAIRAKADADGQYLRRVARIGTPGSEWKGRTISLLRRDELPTPRIAAAAPLFASLTFADDARQTGGVVLYLDHEAYNTRTGAGLAETLEASIVIETLEGAGESQEIKTTVALAVGPDPVLHDGTVGPFWDQEGKPVADRASKTAPWKSKEPGKWLPPKAPNPPDVLSDPPDSVYEIGEPGPNEALRCVAIMGQTLEPNSAAPRFPCSVAFLEPALESGLALRPNTMARIHVRTVAAGGGTETHRSPWSAPIWVHFLPDRERLRPSGAIASRTPNENRITVKLDPRSVDDRDTAPTSATGQNGPLLRRRIWAALMRSTQDATGDPIMRVVSIAQADGMEDGDRETGIFRFPDEVGTTHIRLLEVQVVEGATEPSGGSLFGAASRDSERRIVGIGPLIEIVANNVNPQSGNSNV